MKSKKAFLLGKYTVTIIIAVLCILLLLYVLFVLYSDSRSTKDLRMAEATLDKLTGKMEEAKTASKNLTLLTPEGWTIVSYGKKQDKKPEQCIENCICVCKRAREGFPGIGYGLDVQSNKQIENCNNKGVCKNMDRSVRCFSIIIPTDVEIDFKDDEYIIKKIF